MDAASREWDADLYRVAREQFLAAAEELALDAESRTRLLEPRRALTVNFPVRLDDGDVANFTGYRVQHTLTMGPTKGGFRYGPDVTLGECAGLAMFMTWKCALLELPYGGAKGGVRCLPGRHSTAELERVTRRYAAELLPIIGPDQDIPAPDMGTGEREMAWLYDTYSQAKGFSVPEVVTGKPVVLGGSEARASATGLGVVYALEGMLARTGERVAGRRVVVQGLGNVGSVAARELQARGAIVVGLSDASGGVVADGGLDIEAVLAWAARHGTLDGCPAGDGVDRRAVLEVPCDVVVPAAREGQITAENAGRLDCRLIVEGANGPCLPAADAILQRRGIVVVPDILANAGGVCVSYFEWVQSKQKVVWDLRATQNRVREVITGALERVLDEARTRDVTLRTAALCVAVDRVARAARLRGIYP